MHHRNRLLEELAQAEAQGQTPLVFMHGYPGDLAADGEAIAKVFADARVAFVDTGHTHYNELLNDGRVVYGATRSTGADRGGRRTARLLDLLRFMAACQAGGSRRWAASGRSFRSSSPADFG